MGEITKSRVAMMLLSAAAAVYALGSLFGVIQYATFTLSSPGSITTFTDLEHTYAWLHFVGAAVALAAVGFVVWEMVPRNQAVDLVEAGSCALATLLIAIGLLVVASSNSASTSGNAVGAVGVGSWAVIALLRAARYNVAEHQAEAPAGPAGPVSFVPPWLTAAGGLVLLAIGSGFTVSVTDQGLGIAAGLLSATGVAALGWALTAARMKGVLRTPSVPVAISGLVIVAAGFVVSAVVAGVVFTPSGTLTELRIGVSLAYGIVLLGVVVLGLAAWNRVLELFSSNVGNPPGGAEGAWGEPAMPAPPSPPAANG